MKAISLVVHWMYCLLLTTARVCWVALAPLIIPDSAKDGQVEAAAAAAAAAVEVEVVVVVVAVLEPLLPCGRVAMVHLTPVMVPL